MKKLFLLSILMIGFLSKSKSQLVYAEYKAMSVVGGATMTGADTSYLIGNVEGTGNVTIQANYVKQSGTVNAGSMVLFTSNDGVIYRPYPQGRDISQYDTLDIPGAISTYNLNSTHASIAWELPKNIARYYQVRVWTSSSGNPVGIISGSTIIRKDNMIK